MAKVMISIPDNLLERLEARARANHETRSGFLQRLAERGVANVMGPKKGQVREGRFLSKLIERRCGENPIAVDSELIDSALDVAAEHGLTAYDAAYVATARRHGWTLVSTDVAGLVSKGLAVTPDVADYP